MSETTPEMESTPLIDPNSPLEICRLSDQDHLMTEVAGGLFPERLDLTPVYRVLDLACGPGEWVMEAARSLEVPCVGVDCSPAMLRSARTRAKMASIDDLATFEQMDVTHPLAFADGSFDLVNARFLVGSIQKQQWPAMLQECLRVLKPGGYVLLTEAEWVSTNRPNAERLAQMVTEALWKAGRSFSTDGRMLGIAHALPALLRASGGHDLQQEVHLLNFSYGLPHYGVMVRNLWTMYQLMQPFLTKMGYGSQQEIFALCDRLGEEVRDEAFEGGMFLLRMWARKGDGSAPGREFFLPPSFPLIS